MPDEHFQTLLEAIRQGDPSAAQRLMPLVYDEFRALAAQYLGRERKGHTLQPTALVHEAYLRLIGQTEAQIKNRTHFFAIGATMIRRVLVDHARGKRREKRGGDRIRVTLDESSLLSGQLDEDLIDLNDALDELANLDSRQAQVVELKFFGGLTTDEIAAAIEVSPRTVELDWRMARAWLQKKLAGRE